MASKGWFEQFLTEAPRWIAWPYILSYPCGLVACAIDEVNVLLLPVAIFTAHQIVQQGKLKNKEFYFSILISYILMFMFMELYGRDMFGYFFEFTTKFIVFSSALSVIVYLIFVVFFKDTLKFEINNLLCVAMLNLSISPFYALSANVLEFFLMTIFDVPYRGLY